MSATCAWQFALQSLRMHPLYSISDLHVRYILRHENKQLYTLHFISTLEHSTGFLIPERKRFLNIPKKFCVTVGFYSEKSNN